MLEKLNYQQRLILVQAVAIAIKKHMNMANTLAKKKMTLISKKIKPDFVFRYIFSGCYVQILIDLSGIKVDKFAIMFFCKF